MVSTYDDYKAKTASEKNGLCILDAAERLIGWTVHSGTIYKLDPYNRQFIVRLRDDSTELTSVSSLGSVVPGTYFHDRDNKILYVELPGSADATDLDNFVSADFRLFFAELATIAPHDLSTGFDVEWLPYLNPVSSFSVGLDNRNQIGTAISGTGNVSFANDKDFWASLYDKVAFENKKCFIYSWSRELPITESKIIYRGRVKDKSWSSNKVTFKLRDFFNEVNTVIELSDMQDVSGALLPDSLKIAKQRRVYGYVNGVRPVNIDQVLDGYSLTGTVTPSVGSSTLTGSATSFLNDLSPNDQLVIDGVEDSVTVETIQSDTSLTLDSDFDGASVSGATFKVVPSDRAKRYTNRDHFISGDALKEPSTTVVTGISKRVFTVADTTDFRVGDRVLINSLERTINQINNSTITLDQNLSAIPSASDVLTRPSVSHVYLDGTTLVRTRDYTVPASNDRINLDELAEFNIAPNRAITGTLTFTNTSRSVTGSGTDFLRDLNPGDWVRRRGETDWFEVLQITSETALELRTAATYSSTGASQFRSPTIYSEGTNAVSCDVMGTTVERTKTGTFPANGPAIVKDLLTDVGLSADLNTSTFDTAEDLAPHRIGLVIPATFDSTSTSKARDEINKVNVSILGALVQNEDFKLEYKVLSPVKSINTDLQLDETDVLSFSVSASSKNIKKSTVIRYDNHEFDHISLDASQSTKTFTSKNARFLAEATDTFDLVTLLVDEEAANIYASRYAFLFETSTSEINFKTKLQTARLQVTDAVSFSHPELYERVGSTETRKIASVMVIKKSSSGVDLRIEDLSNAFSRVASITENTALEFSSADSDEKAFNGYITDNQGILESDRDTFNLNLIW